MTRFKLWLFITVVMVMTLTMPSYEEKKRDVCPPCPRVDEPVQSCPEAGTCPECEPLKECVWEQPALTILRKYVRNVLIHIGDQVTLSSDDMVVLEKFLDKGKIKHVHDVHDILIDMIVRVAASQDTKMEKFALWLEHEIGLKLDRLIQFMILALASVILLCFIGFIISLPWTLYDLYQQGEIQQQSKVMKIPQKCEDGDSWLTSLAAMVTLTSKVPFISIMSLDLKVPAKVIVAIFRYIYSHKIKSVPRHPDAETQTQIQQAIPDNTPTTNIQPEENQSLMAETKNQPQESGPRQSDADALTQIPQAVPENTLPTKDRLENKQSLVEETKNPPVEKDVLGKTLPLPALPDPGTSDENHGGVKGQLERGIGFPVEQMQGKICHRSSDDVQDAPSPQQKARHKSTGQESNDPLEIVSLHAEEDCVQHISGGKRKCVDVNRAELENELLQQRINQERELHQLNVAIMKEKNERERMQHQLTVANMK